MVIAFCMCNVGLLFFVVVCQGTKIFCHGTEFFCPGVKICSVGHSGLWYNMCTPKLRIVCFLLLSTGSRIVCLSSKDNVTY